MEIGPDRQIWLEGPAGRLAARLRQPVSAAPVRAVALIFHPHPVHGGSSRHKVLYRLAKALASEAGVPSLRLDFRGAGESEGVHDHGRGEVDDARTALEWALDRWAHARVIGVGLSFGAVVGLRALHGHASVAALVALGLPLDGGWELGFFERSTLPRLVVQGEHDEFGDARRLRARMTAMGRGAQAHVVAGADHLFRGAEDAAVAAVVGYIRALLAGSGEESPSGA